MNTVIKNGVAHRAVKARTAGGGYTTLCEPSMTENLPVVKGSIKCSCCLEKIPPHRKLGTRPIRPTGKREKFFMSRVLAHKLENLMR